MASKDEKQDIELKDLVLFAPLGLVYDYKKVIPQLAKRGRSQLQLGLFIGKMAASKSQSTAERATADVLTTVANAAARGITEFGQVIGLAPPEDDAPPSVIVETAAALSGQPIVKAEDSSKVKTRTAAKRTSAKTIAAEKSASKKSAAKKSAAKKSAARKSTAKRASAKKSAAAKKASAKKSAKTAKRSAAKRASSPSKATKKSSGNKTARKRAAVKKTVGKPRLAANSPSQAPAPRLPIAGYDDLTAREIVELLDDLTPAQRSRVRAHEAANRDRKTIQAKLDRLDS